MCLCGEIINLGFAVGFCVGYFLCFVLVVNDSNNEKKKVNKVPREMKK